MKKKLIVALILTITLSAGAFYFVKPNDISKTELVTKTAIPITIGAFHKPFLQMVSLHLKKHTTSTQIFLLVF